MRMLDFVLPRGKRAPSGSSLPCSGNRRVGRHPRLSQK
jgi:hypothetical protein